MQAHINIRFAQLLEERIKDSINKKLYDKLDVPTLKAIHLMIRDQIDSIFDKSTHKLCHETKSWLTDQFFKSISLNGEKIENLVVLNEYKLSNMEYHDVNLLYKLFNETNLGQVLELELKRRLQS